MNQYCCCLITKLHCLHKWIFRLKNQCCAGTNNDSPLGCLGQFQASNNINSFIFILLSLLDINKWLLLWICFILCYLAALNYFYDIACPNLASFIVYLTRRNITPDFLYRNGDSRSNFSHHQFYFCPFGRRLNRKSSLLLPHMKNGKLPNLYVAFLPCWRPCHWNPSDKAE